MRIDDYAFGRIQIEGQVYTTDVIILADRVRDHWWRRDGHRLDPQDVTEVVDAGPAILIVGTGYYGNLTVPAITREYLEARGIEVRSLQTADAAREFNNLQRQCANVVAALHLTC